MDKIQNSILWVICQSPADVGAACGGNNRTREPCQAEGRGIGRWHRRTRDGMDRLGGLNGTNRTKKTYGIEKIDSIDGVERIEARGGSAQTTGRKVRFFRLTEREERVKLALA